MKNTNASDFKAFILAAGEGRRLKPYTDTMPKPMVPVCGKPILGHTLQHLRDAGIGETTINVCYKKEIIREFLSNIKTPEINISEEPELCNTGYGVKRALSNFGQDPFFVINGDAFWTDGPEENALNRLAHNWDPEKMDILLLLQPVESMKLTKGVGDYNLTPEGQAHRQAQQDGSYMFAGLRICKPEIFNNTPDEAFSFLGLMDTAQQKGRLYALVHDGDWHHISTSEDLERVNAALISKAA